MENQNKKMTLRTLFNIRGGAMFTDDKKNIDIPPKKAIKMNTQDMFLAGEISIPLEGHTAIREEGMTKARIDKNSNIIASKKIDENEAKKAVKEYMAKQKEGMEI